MAIAYVPPGVTIKELNVPTISPLIAVPASICLVGKASGFLRRTDIVTLTGTTAAPLPNIPTGATLTSTSIVSVVDALNPGNAVNGYATTDYAFNSTAKTITRLGTGTMTDPVTVYVTYNYYPADYYQPVRLFSMADVETRFGSPYDATGTTINSHLSYAAEVAFENGSGSVVCQPFFRKDPITGVKSQPTDAQIATPSEWGVVWESLRDIEDINIFVPLIGQAMAGVGDAAWLSTAYTLQDHLRFLTQENRHAIGILGEDSSTATSVGQMATLRTHAELIAARYGGALSEALVLVAPSKFTRPLPTSLDKIYVGGQYAAASIAGMIASRDVSQTLTRKALSGFQDVADYRSKADKNADAQSGLLVIEQRGRVVQVRHAVTINNTTTAKRELSVVRSKYRMIESVRQTLETQIVGQIVADKQAAGIISTAVAAVLEALKSTRDIVDYSDIDARISSLEPTSVEVRFSYKPAFPINYIDIKFALDLSSGELTTSDDTGIPA